MFFAFIMLSRPVHSVLRDIATGAGGLGFDSRNGQIGQSVANGSQPVRCFFESLLRRQAAEIGPTSRYVLWRNTASIMKI